jgi:hypothetical protein
LQRGGEWLLINDPTSEDANVIAWQGWSGQFGELEVLGAVVGLLAL